MIHRENCGSEIGKSLLELSEQLFHWWHGVRDGTLTADERRKTPTRFEAVNRGRVSITRPSHLLTTNAGAGNPTRPAPKRAAG